MHNYMKTILNGVKTWTEEQLAALTKKVSAAKTAAATAQSTADTAKTAAATAQSTADTAKTAAATAQSTADTAKTTKAERIDPVFIGSFSQNRKADTTIGSYSHAEGYDTTASEQCAHAEGLNTKASGSYSHAEGRGTTASEQCAHAEGLNTKASGSYSHAEGTYNIEDTDSKYAHIVGNGRADEVRHNAHTLDWNGVAWFQGRPQFGGNAQDDGSQTVMANGDTEITLKSPSGKLFKISVSDDGVLTTTEVTE